MKDRVPTKVLPNGAIRYGVYDDVGGLIRYEYIKREDEPTQVGHPLSKATLLSDATAALLGGNSDMVPDEAIRKVWESAEKRVTRFPNIQAPYDLNTITTEGIHELQGACTNSPYDEWGIGDQHFWVQVFRHIDGYLRQVLRDVRSSRTFERSRINNAWERWLPTPKRDVGDIDATVLGQKLPGWMPCLGSVLPFWAYPELDMKIGGRFRSPISRTISLPTENHSIIGGRATRNLPNGLLYLARYGSLGTKAYHYNKTTGAVTTVDDTNPSQAEAGYSGLIPVVGSDYTIYVKSYRDFWGCKIRVITPDGVAKSELSGAHPSSNFNAMAYAAYLSGPDTIDLLCISGVFGIRHRLTISTNSISTTNIGGQCPVNYTLPVWVNENHVWISDSQNSRFYVAHRSFTNFSECYLSPDVVGRASAPDCFGNILIGAGAAAQVIQANNERIFYPNFFQPDDYNRLSAEACFYWDKDRGYGVLRMDGTTGTPKRYLNCFDRGGILRSADTGVTTSFTGEMALMTASTSPYIIQLTYLFKDIQLPYFTDNHGYNYAWIRVK